MKEEALKLAYEMDGIEFYDNPNSDPYEWACDAQRMILRLVEELDKQIKPTITKLDGKVVAVTMTDEEHRVHEVLWEAPKPLSDEEIEKLREYHGINDWLYETSVIDFARAIEERHGIK